MTKRISHVRMGSLTGPPPCCAAARARALLPPDGGLPVRDRCAPPRERLHLAPERAPGRPPAVGPRLVRRGRSLARKRDFPHAGPPLLQCPGRVLEATARECPGTGGWR